MKILRIGVEVRAKGRRVWAKISGILQEIRAKGKPFQANPKLKPPKRDGDREHPQEDRGRGGYFREARTALRMREGASIWESVDKAMY